jgi:hypothetical protein
MCLKCLIRHNIIWIYVTCNKISLILHDRPLRNSQLSLALSYNVLVEEKNEISRRKEKRGTLFNRVIPHVYMDLNRREFILSMERKY